MQYSLLCEPPALCALPTPGLAEHPDTGEPAGGQAGQGLQAEVTQGLLHGLHGSPGSWKEQLVTTSQLKLQEQEHLQEGLRCWAQLKMKY